jgi:N-acetyl-anhydromuramyl-L-alanine amidase AmpD
LTDSPTDSPTTLARRLLFFICARETPTFHSFSESSMTRILQMMVALVFLTVACGDVSESTRQEEPDRTPAKDSPQSDEDAARTASTFDSVFVAAGLEFGVPAALLKAVAWSSSRYEMVSSAADFDGAPEFHGLMGLGGARLVEGASLLGTDEATLKADPAANVRAAAAWMSAQAATLSIDRSRISHWIPVVAAYSGIEDFQARQDFVRGEVFTALVQGVGIALEHQDDLRDLETAVGAVATAAQGLSRSPDYERGVFRPSPNFSSRSGSIRMVIIHTCEGGYTGCYSWLQNPRAQASAHYVVSSDGQEVSQLVRESSKAWHIAADYECSRNSGALCNLNGVQSNNFTVGIEHAGFGSQSSWPAGQIDASARLVCDITRDHQIPRDRLHIVGHGQLQPWNRSDPGRNWPWTSYLQKINSVCGTTSPSQELIIDSNNANNDQSRGYIQVSANWKSSTNVAGYYGSGYWYASTAPLSDGAAFFFKVDAAGPRTIEAWWTAANDRSGNATFVAFNAQGERVGDGTVDQSTRGGQWNQVGQFVFTPGWNKVVLSRWSPEGKVVIADALRVK